MSALVRAFAKVPAPNRFINSGFLIDQRNSGAAQTITAGAALAYTVDRWYAACTGANVTGQAVAGVNSQEMYRFTGAASVTGIQFGQRIETASCADLAGQNAVLSVDLANSLLTTVTWTAYYANTADTFGTLASPTRTQIATGTFTVNATTTRYVVPIAIPSAAKTGIEIVLSVGAQTSGTWTIGRAKLEAGLIATPWVTESSGREMAQCQRFYEVFTGSTIQVGGYALATNSLPYAFPFKVTKRAAPTIVNLGSQNAQNCTPSVAATIDAFLVTISVSSTGAWIYSTPIGVFACEL
ncbi:hypothetical protein [Trinickia symbiotica]|uniref:Uncharacterized protein n=1 Tax=Trinickia symbiotica TaxID=863227 RepID=A0A2N7XA44_9BURK|nr:hypothetical protein [Trinickia symbiotica]PMS38460.1 hypothetical protein C0Z20_00815 [Trinickia symbiotica]